MKPSSRAVGEPGTGAYVVKDHPHDPVILSLLQDCPDLANVSRTWSLLDGTSATATSSFRRNRPPSILLITAFLPGDPCACSSPRSIVTWTPPAARPCVRASCWPRRGMDCRVLTTGVLDPEWESSLDEALATLELPARRFQAQLGACPRIASVHLKWAV